MARILVQLKLRLLRNALRSSTSAKVSFLVSTTFAVLAAIGAFVVLALLHGQASSVDVTAVIFTVFAFGWLLLPVFAFGLDGTLDPATLALYPLRLRPLATGLLAASAAGAWPLANLAGLLGVTVGPGCAGCRRAWPRTRSRTPPTGTLAPRCCAWPCWPPSSSCSAGSGSGRWAVPWSPQIPPPSPRRSGARRCRWPGTGCAAR
jgi:hypothetical protein